MEIRRERNDGPNGVTGRTPHGRFGDPNGARQPGPAAALETIATSAMTLVERFELTPVPVPELYARIEGEFKGRAVELATRRFSGGPFRAVTLALMRGGAERELMSVTLSACPDARRALPILGIDYVSLRGMISLAVCDLSPLNPDRWEREARPLLEPTHAAFSGKLPQRKRPAFVDDTFSRLAVFGAARPGQESVACREAVELIDRYADFAARASDRDVDEIAGVEAAIARWCEAMRHNKKEARALGMLFGETALRYLDEFLFTF